jgi:hypothetical protein
MGSFTNLRLTLAVFAGAATLFAVLPRAGAQELIAISDIAGGSSVFVFRSTASGCQVADRPDAQPTRRNRQAC